MGGTGNRFNVADVTITRCVVKLENGALGYSYLSGRNKAHAELAAVIDGFDAIRNIPTRINDECY